jgi:hypothetical protein
MLVNIVYDVHVIIYDVLPVAKCWHFLFQIDEAWIGYFHVYFLVVYHVWADSEH